MGIISESEAWDTQLGLANDVSMGSNHHSGGCRVLMCDGSVKFVSENIDMFVLKGAASKASGEVGGLDN